MEIREVVDVARPPEAVFAYLAEFDHLTDWDPSAIAVKSRSAGPLAVGTSYEVVSAFRGREVDLRYEVTEYDPPRRVVLRGDSDSVGATDEMTFEPIDGGTRVTYLARFTFNNRIVGLIAPFVLRGAFKKLGQEAAEAMKRAVAALPSGSHPD